jgi:hypothetical protein
VQLYLSGPSEPLIPANWVPLKLVLGGGMLHFFIIHHAQTQSNRVCNFNVFFFLLILILASDHFCPDLYITTAGVKWCGSRLMLPRTSQVLFYFSGPSGSLIPSLWRIENGIPLKPVLGCLSDVALFHHHFFTHSIKPGLQCSCYFADFNASKMLPKGSLFPNIYISYISTFLCTNL